MIDFIFIIIVYSFVFSGLIFFLKGISHPEELKTKKKNVLPRKGVYGIMWLLIGMFLMIFAGFMFL